ncbi:MAG: NAD-dependent epimerase/dehydratase family protein [Puia sp.]|nr:NAD-dependent epimerase/dehydratase family protein [Puia sp.]
MANVLITGGCGFIGSNLAIRLKERYPHYRIFSLDNLKRRGSGINCQRVQKAGVEFVHGDIRCREDLDIAAPLDFIIDAAAEPSVLAGDGGERSRDYLVNTNFTGTLNSLQLALEHKAKFLFLSTSRVYPIEPLEAAAIHETETRFALSAGQTLPGLSERGVGENFGLAGYRSLYGATKLASELIIGEFNRQFGLVSVINRCGVVTGPFQMGKIDQGVVVLWLARHYWKRELSYIGYGGTGKQVRDILNINDLFRLIDWQMNNMEKIDGQTFNVGGGDFSSASLRELTIHCQRITGNMIPIRPVPENRPSDLRIYMTDNARIQAASGWSPTIPLADSLEEIFDWIRREEALLKPILDN